MKLNLLIFYFWASLCSAEQLSGVVDHIEGQKLLFRTAYEDIKIDLRKLSAEQQNTLKSEAAKEKIFTTDLPASAILSRSAVPRKVRNDCSELPLSFSELKEIANNPKVHNILDFLNALPKGTMQTFTLAAGSLSAQRGDTATGVSPMWPRVLRGNIDGRLTFSYTCNPESETYNQVEVIYFEQAQFKTAHFDLNKTASESTNARMELNPQSCVRCHSVSRFNNSPSLRPNWPEYPFWADCETKRGTVFYGSSDDSMTKKYYKERHPGSPQQVPMGCTARKDESVHESLIDSFQNFKEAQKNNPCYQLLPWAQVDKQIVDGQDYSNYPYSTNHPMQSNLALRANLKFTNVYSYLNSQRIYDLIKQSPRYQKMKYFLALEAANCINNQDETDLKKLFSDFLPKENSEELSKYDPQHSPLLYQVSIDAGLKPGDWSMEFSTADNPVISPAYDTGVSRGKSSGDDLHDVNMDELVQGLILKELVAENPEIAKVGVNILSRGTAEDFHEKYACLDELGSGLREKVKGESRALCTALHRENIKYLQLSPQPAYDAPTSEAKADDPLQDILKEVQSQNADSFNASVEQGRKLVQSGAKRCVRCHAPGGERAVPIPASLLFVPQENLTAAKQNQAIANFKTLLLEDDLLNLMKQMLKAGEMPQNASALTATEQKDVLNYFRKLALEK